MATFNLNGIEFDGISADSSRLSALALWLSEVVAERPLVLTVASADASFRSYYRARTDDATYIVMDAPTPQESTQRFHDLASTLRGAGIPVPKVFASAPEAGFMLLQDFGATTLLSCWAAERDCADLQSPMVGYYEQALATLVTMQTRVSAVGLPIYDGAFLHKEMEIFRRWLVHRHLNLGWSRTDEREWQRITQQLVDEALAQPQVFVHRDYHSRNLMVTIDTQSQTGDQVQLGVLDFQDAVYGPLFYDVVSLLKDCYVALAPTTLNYLYEHYVTLAQNAGLPVTNEQQRQPFHAMGMQRHIKAAGIFARLWQRDSRSGYLNDIPRTLNYVVEVGRIDERFAWLGDWIEQRVLPRLTDSKSVQCAR